MGWRASAWNRLGRMLVVAGRIVRLRSEMLADVCFERQWRAIQRERLRGETIDGWPAHFTLRGPRG